mgnify:CR=1 FL=1
MRRRGRNIKLDRSRAARSPADPCPEANARTGWLAATLLSLVFAARLISGASAEEPDEGLFRTSIPAGFEDLSAPQTSLVDVFFLGDTDKDGFELILSDVVMPEMDGPTMLAEIRKRGNKTRFIFMSGYAEDAFERNLENPDDFGFLQKPFSLKQLLEKVKDSLS